MAGVSGEPFTKAELEEIRAKVLNGRSGPRAQSEAAQLVAFLRTAKSSVRRTYRRKLRDMAKGRLAVIGLERHSDLEG